MLKFQIVICMFLIAITMSGCTQNNNLLPTSTKASTSSKAPKTYESSHPSPIVSTPTTTPQSTIVAENLNDLKKNGVNILEDQSFSIELENWGKVKFITGEFRIGGTYKLRFYLVDDKGKVLYTFPEFYGNQWSTVTEVKAISFRDVNKDGFKDIIIIADYMTGVGTNGAIPFHVASIYFQKGKEFVNHPDLDQQLNDAKSNDNIEMILKFTEISNSRNASSNKISETSVPKSPSSTPISTPSDSNLPSEDNKNDSVLEAYKAVLQNKVNFISTDEKNKVYLNDFLTNKDIYETTFNVTQFTVLDMDDDKIPEVVLELTVGKKTYPDFYEVLHYMNGSVYGYIQVYRGFEVLKTDGSFRFSGGAFYNGYGKLRFESNACETVNLGYKDTSKYDAREFFINNKPVTEESYNSFMKEQNGKKDEVWYDFSQKNIETELNGS